MTAKCTVRSKHTAYLSIMVPPLPSYLIMLMYGTGYNFITAVLFTDMFIFVYFKGVVKLFYFTLLFRFYSSNFS